MKKRQARYGYTEREIAKIAGVSIGAFRVAKSRRAVNPANLRSAIQYVVEHWIRRIRREE